MDSSCAPCTDSPTTVTTSTSVAPALQEPSVSVLSLDPTTTSVPVEQQDFLISDYEEEREEEADLSKAVRKIRTCTQHVS